MKRLFLVHVVAIVAIVAIVAVKSLLAQQPQPAPAPAGAPGALRPAEEANRTVIRIVRLQHAKAEQVAQALTRLFGPRSIEAEPRTNSLVGVLTDDKWKQLDTLLRALDAPEADTADPEGKLFIYRLKNRRLDQPFQSLIEGLWERRPGDLRIDGQRNSVLLRGDEKTAASFLELMEQIDQPIDAPAQREFRSGRVRIVWLLRDPTLGDSLRPPPEDLKPVIDELAKAGVTDLMEACQVQVTALVDQPFELTSSPSLGQRGCELKVQGKFLPRKGDLLPLQFTVEANEVYERSEARTDGATVLSARHRLCNFQTTIEAPLSHPVILCVNPIGDATSVFVVKLLP